jgi:hypothetical protein
VTEPDDPSRLFDSSSAPEGLKSALRAAQADVGTDEQVARLARRLGPLLGVAGATGAAAGVGAAAGSGTLGGAAKLGIAAVALLGAAGGAFLLFSPSPSPSAASGNSVAPAPPSLPAVSAFVEPAPLARPSALPEPAPSQPPASASVTSVRDRPVAAPQPSEADLLEQARAALKSDPNRALERATEHARRFPRGVLVQEREVLAIQALRRLGRDAEADHRADAFAKAFPGSAFQRKLKPNP